MTCFGVRSAKRISRSHIFPMMEGAVVAAVVVVVAAVVAAAEVFHPRNWRGSNR